MRPGRLLGASEANLLFLPVRPRRAPVRKATRLLPPSPLLLPRPGPKCPGPRRGVGRKRQRPRPRLPPPRMDRPSPRSDASMNTACKQCGQPKTKEFGHSRFHGVHFCVAAAWEDRGWKRWRGDAGMADTDLESLTFNYDEPQSVISDGMCYKETVVKVGSITVPIFFSIVVLLSLLGNILVLVILGLYESLRSLTNIFILNLALSDLMFTFGLPFWACYYIWGWTLGDAACKTVNFVFSAGFYSSIVFLMLMTVQRYMAVVHPLSDWEKGQGFAVTPIIAWVVSIFAALPAILRSGVMPDPADSQKLYCEYNNITAYFIVIYQQNIFFVVAFSVMSFCYIRILQTILKSRTNKKNRTVRLIFCIVAVFFVGWAPYNVVIFLRSLTYHQIEPFTECDVTHHLDYALYVCQLLAFSHCCLNPVFYVFVGVKFREHLNAILQKIFQEQNYMNIHGIRVTYGPSQGTM
ncbi:chemokine XC receptor 1-like isoform X2 [Electrophorus electricus]|uniref:chemokine XC receptor 1-like isoform X2 n=1 Tax=Electrophorus electricus TaxID=8005 RepID=UPI0015CFD4BA|nr:chemokine XC receptor 1-like isoform X2 [Electrophorus electricus]